MNTMIIPQKIARKGDLVIMPRSDYEALFNLSVEAKTDWLYDKPVSKYLHSRIKNVESEFKKGKATKWNPKR